jgi:uncharacterized protein (DUF58 family)
MKSGRVLVVLLFAVGLMGSLITGAALYSRLLYLSILLVLFALLWTRLSLAGLTVHRRARLQKASVGDVFEEHFEITNTSRFLSYSVVVENQSPMPGASGSRLLTRIGGRQARSYIARTWLTRRGRFLLGPTMLTAGDPFGIFRASRRFAGSDAVVVLPMLFEVGSFPMPPGLLPGGQVIRRKSLDITPHASGVREYVHGDPLKRIHWPTTARRRQLMVKEFEQDPRVEVWIFLDVQKSIHAERPYELPQARLDWLFGRRPKFTLPPSTLEYAISIAASLTHYYIGQKRAVGLVSAGRTYTSIPAEHSERQEGKILETLAYLEAEGRLSLAGLVGAQAGQLSTGSSIILITPTTSSDLLIAVDDLQRRSLHPVVVLLMAETFGGKRGAEALAKALTDRGVPVCPVSCDADLGQTLSQFGAGHSAKDSRTWQRPVLSHLT